MSAVLQLHLATPPSGRLRRVVLTVAETSAIRSALDREEPRVKRALRLAWAQCASSLTSTAVEAMRSAGRVPDAVSESWSRIFEGFVEGPVAEARTRLIARATAVLSGAMRASARLGWKEVETEDDDFSYDPGDAGLLAAFQGRDHSLIRDLTAEQRAAVEELLRQQIATPLTVEELARRLRQIIGLTKREAAAVAALRARLIEQGLTADVLEKTVQKYADYLLRLRSERIARTELSWVWNQAQLAQVRQAVSRGALPGDVTKVWQAAPDEVTCPECSDLDGEEVALEADFSSGDDAPPAHPNCRCACTYSTLVGQP